MTDPDYYAILGVDTKAPPEVIKAAYYALARKYHPDTNSGTTKLGTHFQEITRAHEILSDPLRRAAYDVSRDAARAWQAPPSQQQPSHPYWTTPRAPQPPPANPPPRKATNGSSPKATVSVNHMGEAAPVLRRLIAVVIDIMLWVVVTVVVYVITTGFQAMRGISSAADARGSNVIGAASGLTLFVGPLVYWIICWSTIGRTVGTVCMDARVSRPDGSRLGFLRATGRLVACVLSILPLGLGFWWAAWDERHLAWHDKLAGSVVRRR